MSDLLLTALLALGVAVPGACVNRQRIEACETACAAHGGYEWVVVDTADFDCICTDWAFVEIGGGDA